jgi:hypothetical protein
MRHPARSRPRAVAAAVPVPAISPVVPLAALAGVAAALLGVALAALLG